MEDSDRINLMKQVICKYYGISESDLCGKRRTKNIAEARMLCTVFIANFVKVSSKCAYGMSFTSIRHSKKVVYELYRYNFVFRKRLDIVFYEVFGWGYRDVKTAITGGKKRNFKTKTAEIANKPLIL